MHKILVALKRAVDYNVRIRVSPNGGGVVTDGVKMSINPFDEIALEEALRIREKGQAQEVIVISIGPEACQQQLRTGLAMGADRAIHVLHQDLVEPLDVARVLHKIAMEQNAELVILGKQSIDGDNNQTGQMLAALWDRPQGTFVSKLTIDGDKVVVVREVDAGHETIAMELPAVVTTDLRLNQPRYVKMPDIMKAKGKPLSTIAMSALGVEPQTRLTIIATQPPKPRQKGRIVEDVAALVDELRQRGLVR